MTTIKASSDMFPRENKATAFEMSGAEIEQACRVGFASSRLAPIFHGPPYCPPLAVMK